MPVWSDQKVVVLVIYYIDTARQVNESYCVTSLRDLCASESVVTLNVA